MIRNGKTGSSFESYVMLRNGKNGKDLQSN